MTVAAIVTQFCPVCKQDLPVLAFWGQGSNETSCRTCYNIANGLSHGRPLETACPMCATVFLQPQRKQGGGSQRIYCSARCRALDWSRGKGATSRKAAILKYDNKPESKAKKAARSRKTRLKQYHWTQAEFDYQLQRQNNACYGCLETLTESTARIDHDHATGAVRGLLCDSCNWSLGHAKDDPSILRRLMAYLDYKREFKNIYLVGALKNTRIPEVGNRLRAAGFDVMDEWYAAGETADTSWQAYEQLRGRTYLEALRGRTATNVFLFDRVHIDMADIVILVMPAGKSAMLELGYAKGRGKYTCILLDANHELDKYEVMPNFADAVFATEDDLLTSLTEYGAPHVS